MLNMTGLTKPFEQSGCILSKLILRFTQRTNPGKVSRIYLTLPVLWHSFPPLLPMMFYILIQKTGIEAEFAKKRL